MRSYIRCSHMTSACVRRAGRVLRAQTIQRRTTNVYRYQNRAHIQLHIHIHDFIFCVVFLAENALWRASSVHSRLSVPGRQIFIIQTHTHGGRVCAAVKILG